MKEVVLVSGAVSFATSLIMAFILMISAVVSRKHNFQYPDEES